MLAIKVQNLKKKYPIVKRYREIFFHPFRKNFIDALNGVNLEVEEGTCFCLLGPNGAGKTTFIKVLSTVVLPDEGKASVNGCDIISQADRVKSSIGYAINDERSLYWRLTGRQNLEFFAVLSGLPSSKRKKRVEEVVHLTGLEEAIDLRFNTYSTGMKQMMSLARALLHEPDLLFVDEPTRSLDPQSAERIRQFLRRELADKQGKTVFWATHNLEEAQEYAHKLAVIDKGKIKITGKVSDLTENQNLSIQEIYERAVEED